MRDLVARREESLELGDLGPLGQPTALEGSTNGIEFLVASEGESDGH